MSAFTEGTKQILLSDAGHGKLQVMPGFSEFAYFNNLGGSGPADYRLYIHIHSIGEKIYYGFGETLNNNDQLINDCQYRIKDPSGNIVVGPLPVPSSGTGFITTFNQAISGPSGIVGASGYPSLSYTPLLTGDYFIEFNFASGGFGGNDRCKFKYFDITVASAANTAIDGRIWSKAWQFTADQNSLPFDGKFFVYTTDSIVTSVNSNGMAPYVFTIACNQYGCYNTGNFITDRQSVPGNHIIPQYKIFLNNPDSVVYPTGLLGSIIPPVTFLPNCSGSANINITVNKSGNVDVLLDINPLPGAQPEDRTLSSVVIAGLNVLTWDGLDGLGNPVPNGKTFNIALTYINGLTNLPINDIDENPNGFIIDLKRPPGADPKVYWDDSQVGGTVNLTGCLYTLPNFGCHTVNLSVGNNNTINTWWYAATNSLAPVVFYEKRMPGPLGPITGTTSMCPGTSNLRYFVLPEANTQTYQWSYSGTGVTINGNGNDTVYIDFSGTATSGVLSVVGVNDSCGVGASVSTKNITLLPFPNVTLNPYSPVCIDLPAFPLFGGSPMGGTYTIAGVPVITFNPMTYGVGTFPVTYTYSDPVTGCVMAKTENLVVNPLPVVTLANLLPVCQNIAPFALTGGLPLGGTYSGPGVTAGGMFDPALAGPGVHNIVYSYTNGFSCTATDTKPITVFPVTPATLANFPNVCVNLPPFALTGGLPAGGVYTGTGVTAGVFDPAAAGPGTYTITYTYTDANSCVSFTSKPITVLPLPGAAGAIAGPALLCQGAFGQAYSTAPITNSVTYQWTIIPPAAGTVIGTAAGITINWSAGFSGVAQVFVNGVNGCGTGTISAGYSVTLNPKPVVTLPYCFDSVTVTTAQPFILKGATPLGGTYSGPGVNSVTSVFTPATAGGGTHTITYIYTNTYGCAANANRNIIVRTPVPFACGTNFTDFRDGKSYPSVQIGLQCWMAKNLDYGAFRISSVVQQDNCVPEKYCFGDNVAACTTDGGLYQWDELMTYRGVAGLQGLCPPAWHIPTDAEWNQLFAVYITNGFAGSPLKFTGYSGFNALLSGVDFFNINFNFAGFATLMWTSDSHGAYKAWAHGMNSFNPSVSLYPSFRSNAFSVRCIKD